MASNLAMQVMTRLLRLRETRMDGELVTHPTEKRLLLLLSSAAAALDSYPIYHSLVVLLQRKSSACDNVIECTITALLLGNKKGGQRGGDGEKVWNHIRGRS